RDLCGWSAKFPPRIRRHRDREDDAMGPISTETDLAPDPAPARPVPTLMIIAGDEQTAELQMTEHGFGMALFQPVSVLLRDADGVPLAGELVEWSVGETPGIMGVQMDPHGTAPCIVVTDADGVATLNRMQGHAASAFYDHGPFTLVARHGAA